MHLPLSAVVASDVDTCALAFNYLDCRSEGMASVREVISTLTTRLLFPDGVVIPGGHLFVPVTERGEVVDRRPEYRLSV